MRNLVVFLLVLALALPLAAAGAQGPKPGEDPLPGRFPPGEGMPRPEGRPERRENAHPTSLLWHVERVDAEKTFSEMGPHSLALDASGHPHIAYGQDHLYYAWHDGSAWHLETVDPS